jgi:ankyrin repeat protein
MAFTDDKDFIELIDAAVEDQAKAVELLRAKPDLIARRNRLEETALHFLAVENFPQGVEFLCSHGAEVDCVDFSKATPLRHAASLGHEEIVRILLAHGANPNVEDNIGETPLSSAERSGNKCIVEMLVKAGAKAEGAPPNGGPATSSGNSGVGEGPPSVS